MEERGFLLKIIGPKLKNFSKAPNIMSEVVGLFENK